MNEDKNTITGLEKTISELEDAIVAKDKQLERYQQLAAKYRKLKRVSTGYKRDRLILLLFSMVLIIGLSYQGYKHNQSKVEKQKMQELYKSKSGEGPNPDIYKDVEDY